jgi:hypothetical protein
MSVASVICLAFLILPIPIGIFWVWIYRNRRTLNLPDWLSGILAQGIISGHKVNRGQAQDTDYAFIIIATVISVLIIVLSCYLLISLSSAYPASPETISYQESYSLPIPERTRRATPMPAPAMSNNSSEELSSSASQSTEYAQISCAEKIYKVNLRRTPGYINKDDSVDSIYEVPCGESVELLGDTEYVDGLNWWKVSWNGYTGWIADHTGSGRTILIFNR